MSTDAVSTGTPTLSTAITSRRHEALDDVEVVDHEVEDDVDVGAAVDERREPMALDEARLASRPRPPPAAPGLKRSRWPDLQDAPARSAAADQRRALRDASTRAASRPARRCPPRADRARPRRGRASAPRRWRNRRAPRARDDRRRPRRRAPPRPRAPVRRSRSTTATSSTPGKRRILLGMKPPEMPHPHHRRAQRSCHRRSRPSAPVRVRSSTIAVTRSGSVRRRQRRRVQHAEPHERLTGWAKRREHAKAARAWRRCTRSAH